MATEYRFVGQELFGEMANQLDASRVSGISGTEGYIVYTNQRIFFVQAYEGDERVQRNQFSEGLAGLLHFNTKQFASQNKMGNFERVDVLKD